MTEERTKKSHTGGMVWVMIVSVTVNIFLAGIILGLFVQDDGGRPPMGGPPMPPRIEQLLSQLHPPLPEKDAKELTRIFEQQHGLFEAHRRQMDDARGQIFKFLGTEVVDKDSLRKVFQHISVSGSILNRGLEHAISQVMEKVSYSSRKQLVLVLEKHVPRGPMMPPPQPPPQGPHPPRSE